MCEYVISYTNLMTMNKIEMERINASSRVHALKLAAYRACGMWFEDPEDMETLTEDEVRQLADEEDCFIEVLQI